MKRSLEQMLQDKIAAAGANLAAHPEEGPLLAPAEEAERQVLLRDLDATFGHVVRQGGVGPREARALDDYALDAEVKAARAADVETRWQDIPDEVLLHADTALTFADPAGRRFLLPAYIGFSLRNPRSPFALADHAARFLAARPLDEIAHELGLDAAQGDFVARYLRWSQRMWPE